MAIARCETCGCLYDVMKEGDFHRCWACRKKLKFPSQGGSTGQAVNTDSDGNLSFKDDVPCECQKCTSYDWDSSLH